MTSTPISTRTRAIQPVPAPTAIRVRQRPGATVAKQKPAYWPNGAATYEHGTHRLLGYSFQNKDRQYEVWSATGVFLGYLPGWDFGAGVALMRKAL